MISTSSSKLFSYALAVLCLVPSAVVGFVPTSSSLTHVSQLFYVNEGSHFDPKSPSIKQGSTLYDILGASNTASREELKARYVQLAKYSHPDAQIGWTMKKKNAPGFGEIAAAWRVLGDAKSRANYDRRLAMRQWSEDASKATCQVLDDAAPVVATFLTDVVGPFMGRAAASMSKAVTEAVVDMQNNKEQAVISSEPKKAPRPPAEDPSTDTLQKASQATNSFDLKETIETATNTMAVLLLVVLNVVLA